MSEFYCLFLNRFYQFRMAVTNAIHGNFRQHAGIFGAFYIPEIRTFSEFKYQRVAFEDLYIILLVRVVLYWS
jgi:hypothetical protein